MKVRTQTFFYLTVRVILMDNRGNSSTLLINNEGCIMTACHPFIAFIKRVSAILELNDFQEGRCITGLLN